MIIKRIQLKNIRSYKSPEPIELDTGHTLFEGDIGSGKSTILSAIEFALFGLGDQNSSYLLRHGEKTGSVLLEFEVLGKPYEVYRSLERKRSSIAQKDGYIIEDGVRTDYSVTEMKNRILKILNFNECPRPKTSSLIYRYAVFTPQEMMKEVLFQPVERRLDTLRRAFRIEDYSIIVNNAQVLVSWLGSEARLLERQTDNIGEKREELELENQKLEEFNTNLGKVEAELSSLKEEQTQILKELKELQPRKEVVKSLEIEIPMVEKSIREKDKQLKEIMSRISNLKIQLAEISEAEKIVVEIKPEHEEYLSKKERADQIEPQISQIQDLQVKRNGFQKSLEKEKKQLEHQILDLQEEIAKEDGKINRQKSETLKITELEQDESNLTSEVELLPQLSDQLITLNSKHASLQQAINNKNEQSRELETELEELRAIGVGAPCPKCKQQLTQQHYSKVEQDYQSNIGKLMEEAEAIQNEDKKTVGLIEETSKRKSSLKEMEKQLNKLRQTLSALGQQQVNLVESEGLLNQRRSLFEQKQRSLNEESFGENEREEIKKIESQLEALKPVKNEYDETKSRLKELEKLRIAERYLTNKAKIDNKENVTNDLSKSENQETDLATGKAKDEANLRDKTTKYDQEKPVLKTIETVEAKKEETDSSITKKEKELVGVNKDIERSNQNIDRIRSEIEEMENQLVKRDELKQYRLWISEYFVPAAKEIETNVLTSINTEFNLLFQKWISYLLETGDITVRVDGNFTPIIEQNGYEMDVESLSGGEKTSVALAYRLALNVMVKKVCDAMQSNLLILDEPTDGFSRGQLFRLRDILQELTCEQVITVSHESELEGFVDKIYRITKEAGESKITSS